MGPPVTAFPQPRLQLAVRRTGPYAQTLAGYTGLCDSGRSALYHALVSARFPPGCTVWLLSFRCGVEVDAVLRAGSQVDFYRGASDLSCDLEDLDRQLRERPGPVLVIHYYGSPQPSISDPKVSYGRLAQD